MTLEGQVRHGDSVARRWNRIAVCIALLTGLAALLVPLGTSSSVDSNGVETSRRVSLLANEGLGVLIVVAVPVVLVALPLAIRRGGLASYRARVVIVVLLTVLVLLGAMSIGLFFIPTLAAMIASMSAQSRAYDRSAVDVGQRPGAPTSPRPQATE